MTRKREPIDDIIDAFVWMEAQGRKKHGAVLGIGRCGVSPLDGVAESVAPAIAARGKPSPA
jgi:hypothetical protein